MSAHFVLHWLDRLYKRTVIVTRDIQIIITRLVVEILSESHFVAGSLLDSTRLYPTLL